MDTPVTQKVAFILWAVSPCKWLHAESRHPLSLARCTLLLSDLHVALHQLHPNTLLFQIYCESVFHGSRKTPQRILSAIIIYISVW